ncbi:DUF3644 domain-containing protein [Geobacter sulfurreducens]|uniref:DUF3644 domain-containing protein n=1 Tax=Geobacter sulfurreducens TaxID=35554 RepID=UPI0001D8F31B|nr:DUF3644 domain-containing protein [Geobacter sulfurreducens]ADI85349.1 protein of unknown function DUF3644 [Geobacter sulfurreducens KN400]
MKLRLGKTKSILRSSIDSALLAVEVYNKPRTEFRTQAFISLMVMAWIRLFHAYFNHTIGPKYYYKKKGTSRYETIDGEKKAWELKTCINEYGKLKEAEKANLDLFVKLRNKIEHRHIEKKELDVLLFGECQALLYNYETLLIELFGIEYALNENIVYSLQFSTLRDNNQIKANRRALSEDLQDLKKYIDTYRTSLPDEVFNSQSYSVKLIQIPKISNTERSDLAVEFVRWDSLSDEDKKAYEKLTTIIKDRVVKQSVVNLGGMKPGKIVNTVKERTGQNFTQNDHKCLYVIFGVRPDPSDDRDPFNTNPDFCHYDEVHGDYVYYKEWVDCIVKIIEAGKMKKYLWTQAYRKGRRYNLQDYL